MYRLFASSESSLLKKIRTDSFEFKCPTASTFLLVLSLVLILCKITTEVVLKCTLQCEVLDIEHDQAPGDSGEEKPFNRKKLQQNRARGGRPSASSGRGERTEGREKNSRALVCWMDKRRRPVTDFMSFL